MTHKELMKVAYRVLEDEPLGLELDAEVMADLVRDVAAAVAVQDRPHAPHEIRRAVASILWREHHQYGRPVRAHLAQRRAPS